MRATMTMAAIAAATAAAAAGAANAAHMGGGFGGGRGGGFGRAPAGAAIAPGGHAAGGVALGGHVNLGAGRGGYGPEGRYAQGWGHQEGYGYGYGRGRHWVRRDRGVLPVLYGFPYAYGGYGAYGAGAYGPELPYGEASGEIGYPPPGPAYAPALAEGPYGRGPSYRGAAYVSGGGVYSYGYPGFSPTPALPPFAPACGC